MVHEDIIADELEDLFLDEDRQVQIGGEGDLKTVHGVEQVQQGLAIRAGSVLRPLVGEPISSETFEDIQQELLQILNEYPQIVSVSRLTITEIDKQENTITMKINTDFNNEFDIEVDL